MYEINVISILLILSVLTYFLMRDYQLGLRVATAFLIFLPIDLRIDLPEGIPSLTIHRLILIVILIAWFIKRNKNSERSEIPFLKIFVSLLMASLISLVISINFVVSLKAYLDFIGEIFIFYIIVMTSIKNETDALKILESCYYALTLVAVFSVIERYTGFSLITLISASQEETRREVTSTYPHRILLGTAMAMGWSLAFAMRDYLNGSSFKNNINLISIFLLMAGCYFATSRGPWIALLIASIVLFALGSSRIKKRLAIIAILAILVIIARPGIRDTIDWRFEATKDPTSQKGKSYQYRWLLWEKAYKEINKSPERLLFGYGPGTRHAMNLEEENVKFDGKTSHYSQFWSWDNHYAGILLETGFVGLSFFVGLYVLVLMKVINVWKTINKSKKDLVSGIVASIVVLCFMMTNVSIFAPQLDYLFWILVAVSVVLQRNGIMSDEFVSADV